MITREKHLHTACNKELAYILKQEAALQKQAAKELPMWKSTLAEKVPGKVTFGLQTAFDKAFSIVFEKGTSVIDKTYAREELVRNYQVQDYAVHLKGSRRELKRMWTMAAKSNFINAAVTTAEGTAP